jgi:serine/threonine protein kinase
MPGDTQWKFQPVPEPKNPLNPVSSVGTFPAGPETLLPKGNGWSLPPLPDSSQSIASRNPGVPLRPIVVAKPTSLPGIVPSMGGKKQAEKISLSNLSIGRYELKSIIGGSPIGDVYLTYDRLREQDVALKAIQTNMIPAHLTEGIEGDYNLFQAEMDLLHNLDHPHLSKVMNLGKSYISGYPFIYKTMPFYAAGSLQSWLTGYVQRNFTPPDVAKLIKQLADALQYLHDRGLFYQNFKQTNVLVVNETDSMRDMHVVLADLPFVHDIINLPKTPESYRYYAPEQWEGDVITASDQYGLAVIAYELMTGRPPFQGTSEAVMRKMHLTMPPPAPSSFHRQVFPYIDRVLLRGLAKRPEDRFENVTAFANVLEQATR